MGTEPGGEGWVVLRAGTVLDQARGEELLEQVRTACEGGATGVVLDLADVEEVRPTGVGALIGCLRAARAAGGDFRLAAASRRVTRVLRVHRTDRVFRLHDSVHEAIAAGEPPARRLARRRRGRWRAGPPR